MLFVNYRSLSLKRKSIIRALYIIRRDKLGTRERDQQKHLLNETSLILFLRTLSVAENGKSQSYIAPNLYPTFPQSLSPFSSFCRTLICVLLFLAVLHFYTDLLPKSFSHLFLSLSFIFSHLSNYISLIPLSPLFLARFFVCLNLFFTLTLPHLHRFRPAV